MSAIPPDELPAKTELLVQKCVRGIVERWAKVLGATNLVALLVGLGYCFFILPDRVAQLAKDSASHQQLTKDLLEANRALGLNQGTQVALEKRLKLLDEALNRVDAQAEANLRLVEGYQERIKKSDAAKFADLLAAVEKHGSAAAVVARVDELGKLVAILKERKTLVAKGVEVVHWNTTRQVDPQETESHNAGEVHWSDPIKVPGGIPRGATILTHLQGVVFGGDITVTPKFGVLETTKDMADGNAFAVKIYVRGNSKPDALSVGWEVFAPVP